MDADKRRFGLSRDYPAGFAAPIHAHPRAQLFNAVNPGPIVTKLRDRIGLTGAALEGLLSQIPAGRRGTPIAQVVVFLASDECAFHVGSKSAIGGGMSNL